jgi:hypothetical protein
MSHAPRGHFATGGGLTAVLARDQSRQAIWEAIKARRTYATTGARLLLDVSLRLDTGSPGGPAAPPSGHGAAVDATGAHHAAGDRYPMGTHLAREQSGAGSVEVAVAVHGTAPLWRAELLRWPDVLYRHPLPPPALPAGRHAIRIGWTGARIRARHRLADWRGTLRVVAGSARFAGAAGWGFDQPEHGIVERSARHVTWVSETAGDWDGIVVEVEGADDATLEFATGPATFRFSPAEATRSFEIDAGGVGRRVVVEPDPGPGQPRAVAFAVRDTPPAGRSYYLARITQQDGHITWSSPIVVDR